MDFTPDEKRFILAEMIKASPVEIEALVAFVRANGIPANLLSMQLPHGRNMKQCMEALGQLGVPMTLWHTQAMRPAPDHGLSSASGITAAPSSHRDTPQSCAVRDTGYGRAQPLALMAPQPSNVPVQSHDAGREASKQDEDRKAPKKRGRPPKADAAKRDLRRQPPQPIAPRPPAQQVAGYLPILPARAPSPAATPQSIPSDDSRSKKRRRMGGSAS